MLRFFISFVPFILYPGVFLGLFLQYGANPGMVAGLALLSVIFIYFAGIRRKSPDKVSLFYKNTNLAVLALICFFLTVNIWSQVMAAEITDFIPQLITLVLVMGLCAYSLLLDSVAEKKSEELNAYSKVHDLMNRIHFVLTCCTAALITNALLILMMRVGQNFPGLDSYTSRFLQRGLIPPLTLFLFVTGILILLSKFRKLKKESREIEKLKTLDASHQSILHQGLTQNLRGNLNRESLDSFMNIVHVETNSFYNLPRYITWAIPILGFLGTVLGISLTAEGIGKLVNSETGLGELSSDLGAALSPLGIAFDTTLVALSLSLVLVLLQLLLQRFEDDLLLLFETCMENSPNFR